MMFSSSAMVVQIHMQHIKINKETEILFIHKNVFTLPISFFSANNLNSKKWCSLKKV